MARPRTQNMYSTPLPGILCSLTHRPNEELVWCMPRSDQFHLFLRRASYFARQRDNCMDDFFQSFITTRERMNKTTALRSFQKSFYVCILHCISNSLSDGANFFRVGNFIPRLLNKMPMLPDWQARSKCVFRTNILLLLSHDTILSYVHGQLSKRT